MDNDPRVTKTNKLAEITNMIFNLDELDNTINLEDGRPSNTLFTYHKSGFENFTHFEPVIPQYRKLKNVKIVSLTLKILTDQNNNIIADGQGTTVIILQNGIWK